MHDTYHFLNQDPPCIPKLMFIPEEHMQNMSLTR